MDGWSVAQSKIKARPVEVGHKLAFNITFHLRPLWLQNLVAINSESESRLTLFPSFCAPPSEIAALFDSNLRRISFLGQVVNLDLLLCRGLHKRSIQISPSISPDFFRGST